MRRIVLLFGGTMVAIFALLLPASAADATVTNTAHQDITYAFALLTPNTAVAPVGGMMAAPGDWIQVSGGGAFTPTTRTVHAGGLFVHHSADGGVRCRGTWNATALTGWTDFGVTRAGRHGGTVSMLVTHRCATTAEVHTGVPMTVTSTRGARSGHQFQGVTVGEFTQPTGGRVIIRAYGSRH